MRFTRKGGITPKLLGKAVGNRPEIIWTRSMYTSVFQPYDVISAALPIDVLHAPLTPSWPGLTRPSPSNVR